MDIKMKAMGSSHFFLFKLCKSASNAQLSNQQLGELDREGQ
jgi:hypothetical protein